MPHMTKAQLCRDNVDPRRAKIVGNNTIEYMDGEDRVIRHFQVDILRFHPDGSITFNSGGYRTKTTKSRLNKYQNLVSIYQDNRIWYVLWNGDCYWKTEGPPVETFIFADGMRVYPGDKSTRRIEGAGKKPDRSLIRSIKRYSKTFDESLPVDLPGPGDCFICQSGSNGTDHLLSHIEEGYFVPTLLVQVIHESHMDRIGRCAFKYDDRSEYENSLLDSFRLRFQRVIYDYIYARIVDGRKEGIEKAPGF